MLYSEINNKNQNGRWLGGLYMFQLNQSLICKILKLTEENLLTL